MHRTVLAAVALVAVAVGALAEHGAVLVHRCVAPGGALEWLGLRLALVRAGECPDGQVAVGGDGQQVLTLVVGVAVPVLLAHVLATLGGLGVATAVRSVLRRAARVLRLRLPKPVALRLPVRRSVVVGAVARAVPWRYDDVVRRRGPPLAAAV